MVELLLFLTDYDSDTVESVHPLQADLIGIIVEVVAPFFCDFPPRKLLQKPFEFQREWWWGLLPLELTTL